MRKVFLLLFVTISTLLAATASFAGAIGDRTSSPYLYCSGILSNGEIVQVDIRIWSFPTQLTGTITVGDISEPTRINFSYDLISTSQSRPLKFQALTNLVRGKPYSGDIQVRFLADDKLAYGELTCNR